MGVLALYQHSWISEILMMSLPKFWEVLYQFCNKPNITRIYVDYDCIASKDGDMLNSWMSGCPECGGVIFVIDGMHEGVDWESCELISGFTIH